MRAIVIDNTEIQKVIEFARQHPIPLQALQEIMNGTMPPPGDVGFNLTMPGGCRVVFTIEEHPMGWCKHMSVSVSGQGNYPHPLVIDTLLTEFGMISLEEATKSGLIYLEEEVEAVNVISPYPEEFQLT